MSLRKQDAKVESKEAAPRPRPQRKMTKQGGRVEDRIKRRMTMRYADISGPTGLSVPAMPAMPIGMRDIAPKERDEVPARGRDVKEESKGIDTRAMEQENFDPESCKIFLKEHVRFLMSLQS